MIFFADYFGYFLILAAIVLILKEKKVSSRIYFSSFTIISLILSRVIVEILKFFIISPRPFAVLDFKPLISADGINAAFPSGHSAFYFALALPIFFLNKKASYWFFSGAVLLGLARIFTGVHWPLDILVGFLIGVASGFFVKEILPNNAPSA